MYVNRMRLHGVKGLYLDLPEGGSDLPEPARKRLVLLGGNGSGKTTILECIQLLWEHFGEWIDAGTRRPNLRRLLLRAFRSHTEQALRDADLAAMELGHFPEKGQSLWVGMGLPAAWEQLRAQHPTAQFARLIRDGADGSSLRIELPADYDWQTFRQRSMVGSAPQMNIVYFPPDNRTVAATPVEGPRLIDTTGLNWSATYSPQIDLDSVLLTIKALRPQDYEEAVRFANLALQFRNKRIVGFGDDGHLTIAGQTETGTTYRHPPEHLSSGERQFLLLIAYTAGFLRPGGIVLIDEPDLHIHIAMLDQLLETVERIVQERKGQLIVASHSVRVWEWFARPEEQIDLSPWRPAHP